MWFFANVVSLMYLITPFSNYPSPKLIFFTGGNSLMPEDIYSSFISKLKAEYDVAVIKNSYVAYGDDNKNSMKLLSQLYEYAMEGPILPIGHSSGCTTLLNFCSKLNKVDKCILLDPVSNNINENEIDYSKFKSVLQINAEKSYKWKYNSGLELLKNPIPKVPFIPAFTMDSSKFNNITKMEVLDYGHCDILDTAFSNVMHKSFAEGTENRESLDNYKEFLISMIDVYAKDIINLNENNGEIDEINNKISLDPEVIKNTYGIEYKLIM